MSRRFFVETPITGDTATLVGQEAQHLSKVMRAKPGDEVTLFDGCGAEFSARIDAVSRSEVELAVIERHDVDRESPRRITIGVALPKGDRQRWLVEKLVELGVNELVPLVTARSVAQPNGKALDRLRRAVVEASKQCGRNRLMVIGEATDFATFVATHDQASVRIIAHPSIDQSSEFDWSEAITDAAIAIGPEGGFADDEVAQAVQCEWRTVDLGARILRTETAAVAIACKLLVT